MFSIDQLSNQLRLITQDLSSFGAELLLGILFLVLILIDLVFNKSDHKKAILETTSLFGILTVAYLLINNVHTLTNQTLFANMIVLGKPISVVKLMILSCTFLVIVFNAIKKNVLIPAEFYALLIASTLGLFIMVMSANWLMLFIAMELVSIASYIMSGFKFDKKGAEAGMKYLLFGAFSSAIMLYGISLIYGLTGSLYYGDFQFLQSLSVANSKLLFIGVLFAFGGLIFKISAAPYQVWAPDVYEAAPISVVAFLSTGPKIAGIFVMVFYWQVLNNFSFSWSSAINIDWKLIYYIVIALTLLIGNFSALWQNNLKRFVAYSSIAHVGFILLGVAAGTSFGTKSALFYLGVYTLMNFAFLWLLEVSEIEKFEDLKDIGKKHGLWAILLTICCVALAGIPPTVGFSAKFLVFTALLESWNLSGGLETVNGKIALLLLLFAFFNTLVGFFYYFKIPYLMYIKKSDKIITEMNFSVPAKVFAVAMVIPLFILFFKSIL